MLSGGVVVPGTLDTRRFAGSAIVQRVSSLPAGPACSRRRQSGTGRAARRASCVRTNSLRVSFRVSLRCRHFPRWPSRYSAAWRGSAVHRPRPRQYLGLREMVLSSSSVRRSQQPLDMFPGIFVNHPVFLAQYRHGRLSPSKWSSTV